MPTASRNAPCPCGSGRKYKHCCLAAEAAKVSSREQLLWRRLRAELEGLPARMFRFFLDTYGEAALDAAWGEFMLADGEREPFDPETPHLPVFMPWLFHAWAPAAGDSCVPDPDLHGVRPTACWLDRYGRRLSPLLREYLAACLEAPFGFHEVERCEPGRSITLCDVFTGEIREVAEGTASRSVKPGELLYAQLVTVQGLTVLEATGPIPLSPAQKIDLIELRRLIREDVGRIDRDVLRDADDMLREHYLRCAEQALYPAPPQLHNTDGEDVEFHKLVFDIDSAQSAFDALKSLDILADEAELLERAERNADGGLHRVELTWAKAGNQAHAHWNNTVLGEVLIHGQRLTVEVNSRERAERFKQIVAERLGERARLRLDELQSVERMLAQDAVAAHAPVSDAPDAEIEALLAEQIERHYATWPDTALPALDNRTPREAVADPDGREQVEALLRDMELRGSAVPGASTDQFQRLRQRLGLPARA